MRRLLMIMPVAALAFTGFSPAQAGDDVYPTEDTPIVFSCVGTGGYEDTSTGPVWKATEDAYRVPNPFVGGSHTPLCQAWSPDTARSPEAPPVPSDPTDPIGTWDDAFGWGWEAVKFQPIGLTGRMDFVAAGDFACGEGTLTEPPDTELSRFLYAHGVVGQFAEWQLEDFTVVFSNGVGEFTGNAVHHGTGATGEIRDVTGTIVVEDGATYGQCDDSFGASNVAVHLVLTPQD